MTCARRACGRFQLFGQRSHSQTKDELRGPVMMINDVGLFVGMPLIAEEVTATLYCMCDRVEQSVAKNLCQNCLRVD